MTTGKTIALTRWTFVGKVMSLLFNMLPRLVLTFLPRGEYLLISWLQSSSAVILESKKVKSVSTVSPSISHQFNSIQFSQSVVSDSLWLHGLQRARLSCPSLTPGTCLNSRPSSWWYRPTISSSFVPVSSCLQSFPASESFPMSQFFPSGGQSIGFSFNINPSSEHPGLLSFRMDWLDLLAVRGTLKSLLP